MSSIFYIDNYNRNSKKEITYDQLIRDINSSDFYSPNCQSTDIYTIFVAIILSIILEEAIVIYSEDYAFEEIDRDSQNCQLSDEQKKRLSSIHTWSDLFFYLNQKNSNWKITLFTSGTSGIPKKVSHSYENIIRAIKINSNYEESIWGLAYTPTHMAGLQVFFQAFFNKSTLVRLIKMSREQICYEIVQYQITHLSATPTFYRMLLPVENSFVSVMHISAGGERFDMKLFSQLSQLFPNAKISNIYASTEAGSVFSSSGENFTIKENYISWVKIENNELLLHRNIVGDSISLDFDLDGWYATGDIVEIISETPLLFRFIYRKNELINVGGDKVYPAEIEECLLSIDGIKEARVFAKTNSLMGSIVCANVVLSDLNLTELMIRQFLQSKLPEYKIPRMIFFVSSLTKTLSGKIKRS